VLNPRKKKVEKKSRARKWLGKRLSLHRSKCQQVSGEGHMGKGPKLVPQRGDESLYKTPYPGR
jgi:uncharacterized protein affecting Mg2+/Co2+ transport